MPGSIGWQGAVVLVLVLLLVFGPKRLPEMGRSLGRGMREFKDSISGNDSGDSEPENVELTPPPAATPPPTAATPAPPDTATTPRPESERVSS
jgi:sec-independent protein translocase protein TatA